jgi:hypothetical protein
MPADPDYQPIFLKYSSVAGVVPAASELQIAEIAINTADGKIFAKKNDGSVIVFEDASKFARAVHLHEISDVTGLQAALDAKLAKASNLSDLADVAAARTNLSVYSKSESDSAIATAKSEAQSYADQKISDLINGADAALDTLKELGDQLKSDESAASALTTQVNGISTRLTTAEANIVTAQSGADASLKKSSNLSDLADVAAARTNLSVYSKSEVDAAIADSVSGASEDLSSDLSAVSGRVATLEGQNLDSRLTDAEDAIAGLGTMSSQNSNNVAITGGSITGVTIGTGNAALPSDGGTVLTSLSTIRGGTFSGFNGGGGGGNTTPVIGAYFYAGANSNWGTLGNWYGDSARTQAATQLPGSSTNVTLQSNASANMDTWTQPQSINIGAFDLTLTSTANPSANLSCNVSGTGTVTLNGVAFNR